MVRNFQDTDFHIGQKSNWIASVIFTKTKIKICMFILVTGFKLLYQNQINKFLKIKKKKMFANI